MQTIVEIRLHFNAIILDLDNVMDNGADNFVVDRSDELLFVVNHTHNLPAGVTIPGHATEATLPRGAARLCLWRPLYCCLLQRLVCVV